MRQRFVYRDGKLIELDGDYIPLHRKAEASHGVISDEMPATWHPKADRYFTSKSKFRAETKAHGCEELGNDHIPAPRNESRFEDVARDVAQVYNELALGGGRRSR